MKIPEHVLITGGAGGIGSALVKAFSEAGFAVSFTYCTSSEKAEKLAMECSASAYFVDFSDCDSVSAFAKKITDEKGRVDVLVNNAGLAHYGLVQDVTPADFLRIFTVNVQSPFFLTKELLPAMISCRRGTIINISSIWGETGASCEVLYSASKGAIIAYTKALAKELAPSGISVNCIAPGVVDTPMLSRFSEEEKNDLCEEIPAGRFTKAEEIAELALHLAKHSSTALTGQVIGMNGGMYC